MPNGNQADHATADYELYFASVADALTAFASGHGLVIEKYYHEAPVWSLCFSHPSGGEAKIDVARNTADFVTIDGCWWIDDYGTFSRSLKWLGAKDCPREQRKLASTLESSLRLMLSWKRGDWTQVVTGYEKIWGPVWTREEFDALGGRWPIPK